ncbi:prepilin-type N-terminal cleavage/methylation domain-containing protein [Microbacterium sp.]|uniref:prepilin-type N-terminal cleavage/methylation domain-containing protein n=1 Tax=Microbacterium sp. TaxID=51671 RepID=UPI0037354D50
MIRVEARTDDAGLSLVELLIAVFVGAIVLGLVATILTTTLTATAATRDRDLATGRVQAVSTSLSTSLRNATDATVQTTGATVLRARMVDGTCRAWAVADLDGDGRTELRLYSSDALEAGHPAPEPSTSWGVLADRVTAGAGPLFDIEASVDPASDLRRVTWHLEVAASEQPHLNAQSTSGVTGSATVAAVSQEVSARCW